MLAAEQFEIALALLRSAELSADEANLGLIYYYLGKCYQLQGDYKRSQVVLEQAALLNPEDPAVVLGQMYNYRAMGEEEKKQVALEQVLRLANRHPHELAAIYDRAFAYEAMNDDERAWREYQAILACDRELSNCASTFFPAYLSAGRVLRNLNRFEDAKMLYSQAEARATGNPSREAWLAVDWGQLYEKMDQVEDALQSYSDAIAHNPGLVTPYVYRAKLYEQMGTIDAAYLDHLKVVELSNNPSHAHSTFAGFLYRLKNYPEAIEHYHKALRHPTYDDALIHASIGQSFVQIGDEERALNEFEIALETPSRSESYIRSLYGIALHQFGHTDEAITQMERSLALNRETDVETSLNLGQLYESERKMDKAKTLYESLLASSDKIIEPRIEIVRARLEMLQNE